MSLEATDAMDGYRPRSGLFGRLVSVQIGLVPNIMGSALEQAIKALFAI